MRRSLAIALAGALVAGAPSACSEGGGATVRPTPPAVPVRVVTVSTVSSQQQVRLTGAVEAEESVEVRPESTGPVSALGFDHGQIVEAGRVLVRLRDAEARANVDEARARLDLAETQLQRIDGLFQRQNASAADLDRARADRDLAKAQLGRSEEQLRRTVVKAPFAGITGLRRVAPGEVIDPGRVVTRLEAIDRVVVDVEVPERSLVRVRPGLAATVEVDALPGDRFAGEVVFVSPRIEADTRAARVRVRVPNEDHRLRPGMTARVEIAADEIPDAILLPTQAVVTSARGASVWVVGEGDVVELRPVEVADRSTDAVRVVSGLASGDRVAVEGLVRLRPGAVVAVQTEPDAGAR